MAYGSEFVSAAQPLGSLWSQLSIGRALLSRY